MAGVKGSSGLTRGRSLSESSRLVWILSRPADATIDSKVKEMTGVQFRTSEQHLSMKHVLSSTLSRNWIDINNMFEYCKARFILDATALQHFDGCLKNVNTCECHNHRGESNWVQDS